MTAISPPLDVETLRTALDAGASFRYRFFWGHQPREDGQLSDSVFSQWWPCTFLIEGVTYSSTEQYMMAEKARLFGDADAHTAILASDDPSRCKALGRKVKGFEEARWAAARFTIVTAGNVAKFGQDAALRAYLIATGDDILVEASPTDRIWGIGLAQSNPHAADPNYWRGANLLGFALVRARALLR